MPSQIQLDGLLFSQDGLVLQVMNEVLGTFAIRAEVCRDLEPAVSAVTHRRLDAIIVDWEDAESPTRIVLAGMAVNFERKCRIGLAAKNQGHPTRQIAAKS